MNKRQPEVFKIFLFSLLLITGCAPQSSFYNTLWVNVTEQNNITNNITIVGNNITFNITNNITINITTVNNFTTVNNITNNITNEITNNFYTNITNNITVNQTTFYNITYNLTNNITINITNNITTPETGTGTSNLTLGDIATGLGNWSLDKPSYATISRVDGNISTVNLNIRNNASLLATITRVDGNISTVNTNIANNVTALITRTDGNISVVNLNIRNNASLLATITRVDGNISTVNSNIANNNTELSNRITAVNGTANSKALPGTCSAGTVVQNTTATGVQCVTDATGSGGGDTTNSAGWSNSSVLATATSLNVNISGNLSVGTGDYALAISNNTGYAYFDTPKGANFTKNVSASYFLGYLNWSWILNPPATVSGGDTTNSAGWSNSSVTTTVSSLNVNITGNLSLGTGDYALAISNNTGYAYFDTPKGANFTKNVSASWFLGFINWSWIVNAPAISGGGGDTTNSAGWSNSTATITRTALLINQTSGSFYTFGDLHLGTDGSDSAVYWNEDASAEGESLYWQNSGDQFYFTDALYADGSIRGANIIVTGYSNSTGIYSEAFKYASCDVKAYENNGSLYCGTDAAGTGATTASVEANFSAANLNIRSNTTATNTRIDGNLSTVNSNIASNTTALITRIDGNISTVNSNIANNNTELSNRITAVNGTANSKALPGTCASGTFTQNTTTTGVQCAAATASITGGTCASGTVVQNISTAGVPACVADQTSAGGATSESITANISGVVSRAANRSQMVINSFKEGGDSLTNTSQALTTVRYTPFYVEKGYQIESLGFVNGNTSITGACNVGIYLDNGTRYPGQIVYNTSNLRLVGVNAYNHQNITGRLTLKDQTLYWTAFQCNRTIYVWSLNIRNIVPIMGWPVTGGTSYSPYTSYTATSGYSTTGFPVNAPTGMTITQTPGIAVFSRVVY